MERNEARIYVLRFENGTKERGTITTDQDKTECVIQLPHLNTDALMRYVVNYEDRSSVSAVSEAKVVRIENVPQQRDDEPLTVKVYLLSSDSEFTTLPDVGMQVSLMPKGKKSIITSECVEVDSDNSTFCVVYEMPHIVVGHVIEIRTKNGKSLDAIIEGVRLSSAIEDAQTCECTLTFAKIDDLEAEEESGKEAEAVTVGDAETKTEAEAEAEAEKKCNDDKFVIDIDSEKKDEEVVEEPLNNLPDDSLSQGTTPSDIGTALTEDDLIFDDDSCGVRTEYPDKVVLNVQKQDTPAINKTQVEATQKPSLFMMRRGTKIFLQMVVGLLFLGVLLVVVAPNKDNGNVVATVAPSMAASVVVVHVPDDAEVDNYPNAPASVMILEKSEPRSIPMTPGNLRAFYFQANPNRMLGSITGEAHPNSLGITCPKTPKYDADEKTSDVSGCEIAIPQDAKPGEYTLTPKNSQAWFRQDDPSCFVEAVLPYYSSPEDIRNGLRINVESCEWSFDPSRKCFDFSKCTFTVPQFRAE